MNISDDDDRNQQQYQQAQKQQQHTQNFQSQIQFTINNVYGIKKYLQKIWNIGLITYGGPMAHIGIFRKKFIDQMGCISQPQFAQLMTICQSLPGPTSTQLLITISMYATSSFWGGFLAFLIFSMPTFIIMFVLGMFATMLTGFQIEEIDIVLSGFRVVAIAIIFQAFVGLFRKIVSQYVMIGVVFISAIVYYMFQSSLTIIILFIIAGIIGFFLSQPPQQLSSTPVPKKFQSPIYGIKNLILFGITLLAVILLLPYSQNQLFIIFGVFYKIGALVIGGGHVILPLMFASFDKYNYLSYDDFANGFSVISVMPGPMFNLSVYIGTFIHHSIFGALSAFAGLYLPCFFFILAVLPYWEAYRTQTTLRKIINGVCCASIGLILTAAVMLWNKECLKYEGYIWPVLSSMIIVFAFWLLQKNVPIPVAFIIGSGIYFVIYKILAPA